jgi:hypothetical protein
MFEMPVQQCNIAVGYVTLAAMFPAQSSPSLGPEDQACRETADHGRSNAR